VPPWWGPEVRPLGGRPDRGTAIGRPADNERRRHGPPRTAGHETRVHEYVYARACVFARARTTRVFHHRGRTVATH